VAAHQHVGQDGVEVGIGDVHETLGTGCQALELAVQRRGRRDCKGSRRPMWLSRQLVMYAHRSEMDPPTTTEETAVLGASEYNAPMFTCFSCYGAGGLAGVRQLLA
jgi:hypothetical protein